MIGSAPTTDVVYVVLDDSAGTSGYAGIAHYTYDVTTANFVLIASQAGSVPPFCLIDSDGDTSVCVETLPDDDTIRLVANGTPMMTATDAAFDVFG